MDLSVHHGISGIELKTSVHPSARLWNMFLLLLVIGDISIGISYIPPRPRHKSYVDPSQSDWEFSYQYLTALSRVTQ